LSERDDKFEKHQRISRSLRLLATACVEHRLFCCGDRLPYRFCFDSSHVNLYAALLTLLKLCGLVAVLTIAIAVHISNTKVFSSRGN